MKTELVRLSISAGAEVLFIALLGHWLTVPSEISLIQRRVPVPRPAGASLLPVADFRGFFEAGQAGAAGHATEPGTAGQLVRVSRAQARQCRRRARETDAQLKKSAAARVDNSKGTGVNTIRIP